MFDDFATYFYENVVMPFEEYCAVKGSGMAGRSRDTRAALSAATSLYHLREHLPNGHSLTRSAVSSRCPDYHLLGDVVNASKHRSLSRGTPQIKNATQIEELAIITEYQDERGPYRWVEKVVRVRLADGSERDLLEILINVMNFWQGYLRTEGIRANSQNYSVPKAVEPRSRIECEASGLNFEIIQGLRFRQGWRLQKYNYATGKIEPFDMTGSKLKFSLYPRVPLTVDLVLRNEKTGVEFTETVALGEDDSEAIQRLRTDEEKQAYVEALPLMKEAQRKLALQAGILKELSLQD